ncbi:MAG TPA: FprA family A-type flavoprotein [Acidobacteriota bacterium]|nr:FprA family A-type flavoprotein [Acidobacteriota bacterium]
MTKKEFRKGVFWAGSVDWDRRLFDSLIPLPDGTSYNAYIVRGSGATALLDAVDPAKLGELEGHLADVGKIDYLVAHHVEQDHSGGIPYVLGRHPEAKVVCTPLAKGMLIDHLGIDENRIRTVTDGETLSLGDRTLRFIHAPWVHWPETMSTYLEEEKILFSCDWFGSHLATSELFVGDESRVYEPAKRYFAEIMLPFRAIIRKNLDKIKDLPMDIIAPSHGPLFPRPEFIVSAYREWASDTPKNVVVLPYVSMHGSTALMVDHLMAALVRKGITVQPFNLTVTDSGKLAMSLVDAATIIVGCPAVHIGPHPLAANAVFLANALRPKVRFASIVGSYGWANKIVETITSLIPNIKAEMLTPVLAKGLPKAAEFKALDALADAIAERHKAAGLM